VDPKLFKEGYGAKKLTGMHAKLSTQSIIADSIVVSCMASPIP